MNILVVDGHQLGTNVIPLILNRLGFSRVRTVDSCTGALRYIHENSGDLSLVITEWASPTVDGRQICDAAAKAGIPTIALGSYYHHVHRRTALSAGASEYMTIPLNLRDFTYHVNNLLGVETEVTPTYTRTPYSKALSTVNRRSPASQTYRALEVKTTAATRPIVAKLAARSS